jgi:alpha-D-ribose 1-methylphosphonate 5-triphosphate synthase subunit PhnH
VNFQAGLKAMAKPPSQAQLAELAAGLRKLLDSITAGELTASSGM